MVLMKRDRLSSSTTPKDSFVPVGGDANEAGQEWMEATAGWGGDGVLERRNRLLQELPLAEAAVMAQGAPLRDLLTARAQATEATWAELWAAVPADLLRGLTEARAGLQDVTQKVREARERLDRLNANEGKPKAPQDVAQWSLRRAELDGYLVGMAPHLEAAGRQYEIAQDELRRWLLAETTNRVQAATAHTKNVEEWHDQVVKKADAVLEDARIRQQADEQLLSDLTVNGEAAIRYDMMKGDEHGN